MNLTAPTVYFTKDIVPDSLIKMTGLFKEKLIGNTAVKLHSGEKGNQNFLQPEFCKMLVDSVGGTVVECNTAYEGERDTTEKHKDLMAAHGWSTYFKVDIMDADGNITLEIPNGKVIKENYIGSHMTKYDSMIILSHFKGHPMGGYGGALKQLSIGCASSYGKKNIHCAGNPEGDIMDESYHTKFLEGMADAASSVMKYLNNNIIYINVMKNLSVDCDCCAVAEDPCMRDIGILASADPVALDQACLDLIYNSDDEGKYHLIERIESRNGIHTIEAAEQLGIGSRSYKLITF